jgi:hypothetical protein
MQSDSNGRQQISDEESAQARQALNLFADAIEAAGTNGIPGEVIASAALTAALQMLVAVHGPELAAKLINAMPERVLAGEFSN